MNHKDIPYIYIIGCPNVGKTTLFNHLTGLSQKTANYPGVTVERKSAQIVIDQKELEIIDLPGTYSLYPNSLDEQVVIKELLFQSPAVVVLVADSTNLQRSLLLHTQINDIGCPILLVLNMTDELDRKGYLIDIEMLSSELGCDIISINAKTGEGIANLKSILSQNNFKKGKKIFAKQQFFEGFDASATISYRAWQEYIYAEPYNALSQNITKLETIDRYNTIESIVQLAVKPTERAFKQRRFTERLDKILMHPFFGYFTFVAILYVVFQVLFVVASFPMDMIDFCFSTISSYLLSHWSDSLLVRLLAEGIIPGLSGILMFVPQIALLYLFITLLEESGYMARVVYLMDKVMSKFGLSGKSVLSLISGTACAIPAIAATRNIGNFKERLITILCVPFMTCSARLPVYAILIALVVPLPYQGLTMLSLYLLGAVGALCAAFLLKFFIKSTERSMLIMELPPYRIPTFYNVIISIKNAVVSFISGSGKIIFSISIILWVLASFGPANISSIEKMKEKVSIQDSYAGVIGKVIEPVIEPLGYDWKIGIALLTSFAAREVFVGTLATIYSIDGDLENVNGIKDKLSIQTHPDTGKPIYTLASGLSLLVFYAFALQCMSTIAAIKKETNTWKWAIFSFVFMGVLAYVSSWVVFQYFK